MHGTIEDSAFTFMLDATNYFIEYPRTGNELSALAPETEKG